MKLTRLSGALTVLLLSRGSTNVRWSHVCTSFTSILNAFSLYDDDRVLTGSELNFEAKTLSRHPLSKFLFLHLWSITIINLSVLSFPVRNPTDREMLGLHLQDCHAGGSKLTALPTSLRYRGRSLQVFRYVPCVFKSVLFSLPGSPSLEWAFYKNQVHPRSHQNIEKSNTYLSHTPNPRS